MAKTIHCINCGTRSRVPDENPRRPRCFACGRFAPTRDPLADAIDDVVAHAISEGIRLEREGFAESPEFIVGEILEMIQTGALARVLAYMTGRAASIKSGK